MTESSSSTKHETTRLENITFDILIALGKEAQFLYSTIDTYTSDAQKANRSDLVNMWNTIKQDRQRHMQMLRETLEKEAKEEKLSK
jgi:rubrerythrin